MNAPTPRFDDTAKEEVRARIDIGTVIGRYITLKPAGTNLKGLCPFHKEKTPSFSVNPARGFFHCFGCGKGGDVFTFLTELEGMSFPEALQMLAEEAGVKLPDRRLPVEQASEVTQSTPKAELLRIHKLAATFFYEQMCRSETAKTYLKGRGLRGETVREFSIGYAPAGWSNLIPWLRGRGVVDKDILTCGLAITKSEAGEPYDRFRDRVIFTIFDAADQPIAFAGRGMEADAVPKYLNSPETPLYHKSRTLYGLNKTRSAIKEEKKVLIVEGYMDFLALYQAGIRNVVATCGTALTPEHAALLRRFTSTVVLVFDGDTAGQTAAQRGAAALLPQGLTVRVLLLPQEDDPDSFVKNRGGDAFRTLLDEAMDGWQFLVDKAVAEGEIETIQGRSAIVRILAPVIQGIRDPIVQRHYRKQLSERLGVDEDLIYGESKGSAQTTGETRSADPTRGYLETIEGNLMRLLLSHPELIEVARARLPLDAITDPISAELYSTMVSAVEEKVSIERGVGRIESPDVKRIVSLLAVSSPNPAEDPASEVDRALWQVERRYLKRQSADNRRRMKANPSQGSDLLAEQQRIASRLSELDRNR